MKTIRTLIAAIFCVSLLGACNTMAGLGKDIEKTGEKIQDKARR